MGLFSKVFGKEACVLCGGECGALHRDKIKGGEYICSDCKRKVSKYVRVSEMDKLELEEHISYMEWQEKLYTMLFEKAKRETYPAPVSIMGLSFADELGMFAIQEKSDPNNKIYHELFRYDQVASYEKYEDRVEENGEERVDENGIRLKLLSAQDRDHLSADKARKGLRAHPYIKREIKITFAKGEERADYILNAIAHLNSIFGVHDDEAALFSFGGSTQKKREFAAQKDLSKLIGGAIKAAKSGADKPDDALIEQFQKTQESTASANTGGLSVYSKRADDAENKIPRGGML